MQRALQSPPQKRIHEKRGFPEVVYSDSHGEPSNEGEAIRDRIDGGARLRARRLSRRRSRQASCARHRRPPRERNGEDRRRGFGGAQRPHLSKRKTSTRSSMPQWRSFNRRKRRKTSRR